MRDEGTARGSRDERRRDKRQGAGEGRETRDGGTGVRRSGDRKKEMTKSE